MLYEYETERLIMRILRPDSAPKVLDFYMRDREIFERYEPDRMQDFYTIYHQKNLLKCEYNLAFKLQTVRYYVFRKEDPRTIIGTVCFHDIKKAFYCSCELGYKFSSAFWHYGYATEAIMKGLQVMFAETGMHRVNAWVLPENLPSIRLLERIGFEAEGICRGMLYMHGQWRDHIHYAILSPYSYTQQRII